MWDAAKDDDGDDIYAVNNNTGICPCLADMYEFGFGDITANVREAMLDKLRNLPNKTLLGHKWPMSAQGAKARADFCRRMAAKLAKKKAKA